MVQHYNRRQHRQVRPLDVISCWMVSFAILMIGGGRGGNVLVDGLSNTQQHLSRSRSSRCNTNFHPLHIPQPSSSSLSIAGVQGFGSLSSSSSSPPLSSSSLSLSLSSSSIQQHRPRRPVSRWMQQRPLYASSNDGRRRKRSLWSCWTNGSRRRMFSSLQKKVMQLVRYNYFRNTFITRKIRRSVTVFVMAALVWLGSASFQTLPSHATTAPSTASSSSSSLEEISRVVPVSSSSVVTKGLQFTRNLDEIVDQYVRDHMFDDDDVYDPIESVYREVLEDKKQGSHPRALREVTTSILGREGVVNKKQPNPEEDRFGIGEKMIATVTFLEEKFGLSASTAMCLLVSSIVLGVPTAGLFLAMIVGGISKRNMDRVMKERYGDTYTVDATIKTEEEVTAPDDDDDDDDDDDEDDDDEDDK